MNDNERKEFWETLCSLTGDNIEYDFSILNSKFHYPRFLYRYRSVNTNNLDALRSNKLFFSKASQYDDPFDTFLHIDIEKIHQEFESNYASLEAMTNLADVMKQMLSSTSINIPSEVIQKLTTKEGLNELYENGLTDRFLSYALGCRTKIQDEIQSICFSENGFNETLWLKYADMHKGFVLIYDPYDPQSLHCGKMDKCKNCAVHLYGAPIYPIYYSNTPYDATNFSKAVMGQEMIKLLSVSIPESLQNKYRIRPWDRERISLIKKDCHKYDEEWRMIANCPMNSPAMVEWVPCGIILGLRTSPVEENLIVSMAREAGIKNIYKSFIDKKNQLNAFLINAD